MTSVSALKQDDHFRTRRKWEFWALLTDQTAMRLDRVDVTFYLKRAEKQVVVLMNNHQAKN
jgi:hypothetical protein